MDQWISGRYRCLNIIINEGYVFMIRIQQLNLEIPFLETEEEYVPDLEFEINPDFDV